MIRYYKNDLDTAKFVESYSYEEKSIVYGLTGGIAEYLTFFDDNVELININDIYEV